MKTLTIVLYTIPQAACGSNKISWTDVFRLIKSNIQNAFPEAQFSHIEFMSPEWYTDIHAQNLLESQSVNFPFVLVNGEIACAESKVNIPKIRKFISSIKF